MFWQSPHRDDESRVAAKKGQNNASRGRAGHAREDRTDDWAELLKSHQANNSDGDSEDDSAWQPPSEFNLERPPEIATANKESHHSQSLRSKLVLALALMLGVVVGIDEIVRQRVIAPEFANLERVAALKDTNRVLSAINTDIDFLSETATYKARQLEARVKQSSGKSFEHSAWAHFSTDAQNMNDRIEWDAIVDQEGNWVWLTVPGGPAPPTNSTSADKPTIPEFLRVRDEIACLTPGVGTPGIRAPGVWAPGGRTVGDRASIQGMTRGSDGELYFFAAIALAGHTQPGNHDAPKTAHALGGAPYYVVGQHFGDAVRTDLEQRTSVRFSIAPLQPKSSQSPGIEIQPQNHSFLNVTSPLVSWSGQPLAQLNVHLPREVTLRSNRTTAFARYLSLCGACASLLLLLLLLQRIVIGRLETIREHTERIAESGIISGESIAPVLRVAGHDEIGQLAKSFDRMRSRLGDAQRRLADASHAAGMSLVADTVIHNVGNVLTNVNSLIETASRLVDGLRIEPLEKLANRLRSDDTNSALHHAMPGYLRRLSETLEDDKDDLAELLETLNDNVQHIHQVIRDQRRHAQQPIKWVKSDLRAIVDEAVKYSHARLEQDNACVNVNSDLNVCVWTDRSLLLQILINIIGNARIAMRDVSDRRPTLEIDLIRTVSTVHIRLRDNGCGMTNETLKRVFDAHFTTRYSGSGLGLHFCAIAVKRIGGTIHGESDGLDQGATFVIELPVNKPTLKLMPEPAGMDSNIGADK
ncbi:ATP-binding protein [Stieleria sp. TO1_6]|uniref:sensor histidine kinase n=1 Tax=Stieleria tagensis TaxID=2956795 RepID=UPI00209B0723|nr:ATP-binding protein [Stieleria tagensis]MCO8120508.1 ATP-binding protein [Stieleria tagensis]